MTLPLTVLFDFKDPYSYLALQPTWQLIDETGVPSFWYPFLRPALRAPLRPSSQADRGARHRWLRACYYEHDLRRYADARQLPARRFHDGGLYRSASAEVAAMGFNWAAGEGSLIARSYLHAVFEGYWDGELDVDSVIGIEGVLEACGAEPEGFDTFCEGQGIEELMAQRESLVAAGGFSTPSYLLAGEAFVGRQHLPLLRNRIEHGPEV